MNKKRKDKKAKSTQKDTRNQNSNEGLFEKYCQIQNLLYSKLFNGINNKFNTITKSTEPMETDEINGDNQSLNNSGATASGDGKPYGSDGTLPVNDRQNNRTKAPDHDADLPTTSIANGPYQENASYYTGLPVTSPPKQPGSHGERKRPNEEMNYNYERSISHGIQHMNVQAQQQRQLQRSLEASKQMLYGVFGNVITILEEYEERELELFRIKRDMKVPKSDIYIPNQSHKTYDDIQSILECQLLLFETQTKVCPAEVLSELHEELKHRTLSWSAVRADLDIKEIQQTDRYIAQLYEILAKGCTFHQPINMKDVTAEVIKGSVQALMDAQQDCEKLGREFKKNPDKKAINPKTRTSERIKEGSHRISLACGNKSLDRFLKADVKRIKKMHNVLDDDLK